MTPASQSTIPHASSASCARATLGVVAISYNEERDLPGFLANLLKWVDEIVIVDDGSTDRTAEIAAAAGSKVTFISHQRTTEEGFAGQRNRGLAASNCDWVLNMDIDERVSAELQHEILTTLPQSQLNAYRYRRLNYFLHRPMQGGGWDSWNHPQLARRTDHQYVGAVHEQCIVAGAPESIGQLKSIMYHLNDEGYAERMRKSMQYCQLEADKMLQTTANASAARILMAPFFTFVKNYFLKRGFRDGVPGLIAAMHAGCAHFRAYALVWDEQNRIPREQLECEIQTNMKEGKDHV